MQHSGICACGQIQTGRVNSQIERVCARCRRIEKDEYKLIKDGHAASRCKGACPREGGVSSAVSASGDTRRRDVVAGPIAEGGCGAGKIGVLGDGAEEDGQRPGRGNTDRCASIGDATANQVEIQQSWRRRDPDGAVERSIETYACDIGFQLSDSPRGN